MKKSLIEELKSGLSPRQTLGLANQEQWRGLLEELVKIRRLRKLSQSQLGDLLGISQSAVSQFEDGLSNPTLQTIKLYAMAVGAEISISVKASPGISQLDSDFQGVPSRTVRSSKPGPKRNKIENLQNVG